MVFKKAFENLKGRVKYLESDVKRFADEVNDDVRADPWGDYEPTLNGKIEALAKHLGVKFDVKSGDPQVVVKKGKK